MFKAALIPIWIEKNCPASLKKLAARPVLIEVEALGATLSGQMIKLMQCGARVLPDEPILLRANMRVKVSFRVANTEYALSGITQANDLDDTIRFEFDCVTRRQMAILSEYLKEAGLLQAGEATTPAPEEPTEKEKSEAKAKLTKAELRRVRREPPPGGIERRVHDRHELEAIATLMIVDKGIVIKCLLLEISLSGCRVFTDFPSHIEQDTPVEVDFVGRGYPLRIAATVKVKTDEYVLGLHFERMSSRSQERLRSLLHELGGNCLSL